MTNLRKIEIQKIEYWNQKLNSKIDFRCNCILLTEYNNNFAYYLIDNSKYKLTSQELIFVCDI